MKIPRSWSGAGRELAALRRAARVQGLQRVPIDGDEVSVVRLDAIPNGIHQLPRRPIPAPRDAGGLDPLKLDSPDPVSSEALEVGHEALPSFDGPKLRALPRRHGLFHTIDLQGAYRGAGVTRYQQRGQAPAPSVTGR